MIKTKTGYILDGLDKEYSFSYDGELLQLIPTDKKQIKPYDFLVNSVVDIMVLKAVTISNDNIFFLNCKLQRNQSGYIAKPAGYVCFEGQINVFKRIVLYGEVINYFYRPNQIVSRKSDYPIDRNGGGILVFENFSEITKKHDVLIANEKAELVLSITRPQCPEYMKNEYSLGKPNSYISIEFENNLTVDKFAEIYMWIQNLFEFLNFKKNVFVENIELRTINQLNSIENKAEVYLIHKKEMELTNPDRTIGYYILENNLEKLLRILNENSINLLFIPKDERDDKYVDPQKYVACCSSFESVFNFAFSNEKMEENVKMLQAKEILLEFIKTKDKEYSGKDGAIRKEFRSLKRIIELTDFSLEQKYRWCIKKYDKYISEYSNRLFERLEISKEMIGEIPTMFAAKRNILIHSNIDNLSNEEIAAYLIVRYLIYVIILDKSGVPFDKVKTAVDCILK